MSFDIQNHENNLNAIIEGFQSRPQRVGYDQTGRIFKIIQGSDDQEKKVNTLDTVAKAITKFIQEDTETSVRDIERIEYAIDARISTLQTRLENLNWFAKLFLGTDKKIAKIIQKLEAIKSEINSKKDTIAQRTTTAAARALPAVTAATNSVEAAVPAKGKKQKKTAAPATTPTDHLAAATAGPAARAPVPPAMPAQVKSGGTKAAGTTALQKKIDDFLALPHTVQPPQFLKDISAARQSAATHEEKLQSFVGELKTTVALEAKTPEIVKGLELLGQKARLEKAVQDKKTAATERLNELEQATHEVSQLRTLVQQGTAFSLTYGSQEIPVTFDPNAKQIYEAAKQAASAEDKAIVSGMLPKIVEMQTPASLLQIQQARLDELKGDVNSAVEALKQAQKNLVTLEKGSSTVGRKETKDIANSTAIKQAQILQAKQEALKWLPGVLKAGSQRSKEASTVLEQPLDPDFAQLQALVGAEQAKAASGPQAAMAAQTAFDKINPIPTQKFHTDVLNNFHDAKQQKNFALFTDALSPQVKTRLQATLPTAAPLAADVMGPPRPPALPAGIPQPPPLPPTLGLDSTTPPPPPPLAGAPKAAMAQAAAKPTAQKPQLFTDKKLPNEPTPSAALKKLVANPPAANPDAEQLQELTKYCQQLDQTIASAEKLPEIRKFRSLPEKLQKQKESCAQAYTTYAELLHTQRTLEEQLEKMDSRDFNKDVKDIENLVGKLKKKPEKFEKYKTQLNTVASEQPDHPFLKLAQTRLAGFNPEAPDFSQQCDNLLQEVQLLAKSQQECTLTRGPQKSEETVTFVADNHPAVLCYERLAESKDPAVKDMKAFVEGHKLSSQVQKFATRVQEAQRHFTEQFQELKANQKELEQQKSTGMYNQAKDTSDLIEQKKRDLKGLRTLLGKLSTSSRTLSPTGTAKRGGRGADMSQLSAEFQTTTTGKEFAALFKTANTVIKSENGVESFYKDIHLPTGLDPNLKTQDILKGTALANDPELLKQLTETLPMGSTLKPEVSTAPTTTNAVESTGIPVPPPFPTDPNWLKS